MQQVNGPINAVLIWIAALLLISCGKDTGAPSTPPTVIGGVVQGPSGPLINAALVVKDAAGHVVTTTTGGDGSYQVNTQGLTPPFLLNATLGAISLYEGVQNFV